MVSKRTAVLVAALLVATASAGCFGPEEDPVTTEPEAETGTTPGDTVEAGAEPNAQPDQTPTVFGTTTTEETANGTE